MDQNPATPLPISHRRKANQRCWRDVGHTTNITTLLRPAATMEETTIVKDLNKVQPIGRLGSAPATRYTNASPPHDLYPRHLLHVHYRRRAGADRDGMAPHHRRDKLAKISAQYLSKGARVYVEGRIRTTGWEDAETDEQRSGVEVVTHELLMLGG